MKERVPLSFFLSFYFFFFSFLFSCSRAHHYSSRPVSRFKYFGRVDDETVFTTRFPFVEKKKREKRKNEKKKKEHEHRAVARDSFGFLSLAIKLMRLLFTGFLYAFVSSSFYTILCSLPPLAHRRPFCRPVSRLPDRRGWRGTPPFRIHAIR